MSESANLDQFVLDSENPWPGLHEFDERGEAFFNGRDQEIADLLRLVNDATLTVVFGASGLGKTSLLRAGVAPRLRQHNKLSVYVRLDPRDRNVPLIEQAAVALRAQLATHEVDYHPSFGEDETLWEFLHRPGLELWSTNNQLLTPVFIFDQFEEMFTLGSENGEAVQRFREDLADLIENRVTASLARRYEQPADDLPELDLQGRHFKVVLSLREDFLPHLEGWRRSIPSLLRNRFRLLPMNGQQALAAVTKSGGRLVDRALGRDIVAFVAAAHAELHDGMAEAATGAAQAVETGDLSQVTIEPALLSLVCTGLNERRKAAHKTAIDQELLSGTGLAIITEFYQGCVRDLPDRARRFIEDELITEGGFRNPYSREDALAQGYLTGAQLETLVKRRLLRVERHLGTDRIELVHDRLTAVVRTFRDQERVRLRREQDAVNLKKSRRNTMVAAVGGLTAAVVALVFWQLWRNAEDSFKAYQLEQQERRAAEDSRRAIERRLSEEMAFSEKMRSLEAADKRRAQALTVASQKNYDQAIALLADPLAVYEKVQDGGRLVRALVDRGRLYALARNKDPANQDLEQALAAARRADSASDEALVLESLAWLHEQFDQKDAAAPLYEKALDKYRTTGDSLSAARVLEWMATQEEMNRRFDGAVDGYRQALESYLVAGDTMAATRVREAIGRTGQWGFLIDLKRAKLFPMRGDRITIGRDVPGISNDLSFTNNFVSRRHLVINHERYQIDDVRSLNGTTINATQMPYGLGKQLADGDMIALANTEVLRFTTQRPSLPVIPPSAWAIFVDGSKRDHLYLTESMYSVGMTSDGLTVEKGETPSALLKIRRRQGKIEVFETAGDWTVIVADKAGDYSYTQWPLPRGQWGNWSNSPARFAKLSADRKNTLAQGPSFQIVPQD